MVEVCGWESITLFNSSSELLFVYLLGDTFYHTERPIVYSSLFVSESSFCPVYYTVETNATGTFLPYASLTADIALDSSNETLVIDTLLPKNETILYIRAFTQGLSTIMKPFTVEICGNEKVQLTNSSLNSTDLVFDKFSGATNLEMLAFKEYKTWFNSSSNNCKIVGYSLNTVHPTDGSLIPFDTSKLVFQDSGSNIVINTEKSFQYNLTLNVFTQNGTPYRMPFNVTVLEPNLTDQVNLPPFFNFTPSSLSVVVNPLSP